MLARLQAIRTARTGLWLPGEGIPVVYRHEMRARCPVRDLIWAAVLVLCFGAVSLALQSAATPAREYNGDAQGFLRRLLIMAALSTPAICLPIAAAMGAFAASPAGRFEETQCMLLTRLTALDVCAGRLLAWLWPLSSALLASLAAWLAVQVIWRPVEIGGAGGYMAIAGMHAVLMLSSLATAALGLLFALRRRPGRVWARGALGALAAAGVAMSALFLANGTVRHMDDPTRLVNALLTINPAVAAASALRADVLRLPWIYERTDAPEYPFTYPSPLTACALYGAAALGALVLASARMRRAYR